ncbi:leukocyte receptor cluster member 1-like [Clytia hemisphaerica]|uniref:leukocyte receptor cluster member 1-like n=1 Tax=Clytia hemisphaerica TaxID=252671 RepID=UPI0034D51C65
MNILPKKRWHVRNRDNKERVREDEENAQLQEKKEQERIALAEQEARISLLRKRQTEAANLKCPDEHNKHLNLFDIKESTGSDVQEHKQTNADYMKEKQAEKESEHKKIGLLTYLGQTSLDEKRENRTPWYLQKSQRSSAVKEEPTKAKEETHAGQKIRMDPMSVVEQHFKQKESKHKKKHKKHKKSHKKEKSSSSKTMEQLRAERLQRESSERRRAEQLLDGSTEETNEDERSQGDQKRRYNSQYMPHISSSSSKSRTERWKPY